MTIHLIAPFHVEPSLEFSHDAFGTLTRLFSKMMYHRPVIEYSCGHSDCQTLKRTQLLTSQELRDLAPHEEGREYRHTARLDSPLYQLWKERLLTRLNALMNPGDIVLHGFGRASTWLARSHPEMIHIEPWVGYDEPPCGPLRVFPSTAWKNYVYGKHNSPTNDFDRVIPHPIDIDEWDESPNLKEGHLLYLGRLIPGKGLNVLKAIAEAQELPILCVGQGDLADRAQFQHERLRFLPPVSGRERAQLYARARAVLMPTRYVEPFGMVSAEAQASGAPVLCSPHGGLPETVVHGITGYVCHGLGDWLEAIERAPRLDRTLIRISSHARFGFEKVRALYLQCFEAAESLKADGWYSHRGCL